MQPKGSEGSGRGSWFWSIPNWNRNRNLYPSLDKCFRFVNLELSDKMLYCIKDLYRITHDSYCGETKSEHDALLKSAHHLTVTDITHQQYYSVDIDLVLVFRSGSKFFEIPKHFQYHFTDNCSITSFPLKKVPCGWI